MMRFVMAIVLWFSLTTLAFSDTFSAGALNVTISVSCTPLCLNGSFVNPSNGVVGTIASVKWIDESFQYGNQLAHGRFLLLFDWGGICSGSHFAYASFPNAPDPTTAFPPLLGNVLILNFLMGAGCDGAYGPIRMTLNRAS